MGFGYPYGDEWNKELLLQWADSMIMAGVFDIYVADTIGIATPELITDVMKTLTQFINIQFGLHLHDTPETWAPKIASAYRGGCRLFDSAIKGYGGCPMAADELTGNIATENLLGYL